MLIGSKVANFDETGTDVNGKTIWVHNSSTSELTYQTINARRGLGVQMAKALANQGANIFDKGNPGF